MLAEPLAANRSAGPVHPAINIADSAPQELVKPVDRVWIHPCAERLPTPRTMKRCPVLSAPADCQRDWEVPAPDGACSRRLGDHAAAQRAPGADVAHPADRAVRCLDLLLRGSEPQP